MLMIVDSLMYESLDFIRIIVDPFFMAQPV